MDGVRIVSRAARRTNAILRPQKRKCRVRWQAKSGSSSSNTAGRQKQTPPHSFHDWCVLCFLFSCAHPRAIRRVGKNNRSRILALMAACLVFNLGPIAATMAETVQTSSALLEQGRKLVGEGKLAEAELVLDRAEKLAPSDPVILTLDARVKGRLGESSSAVALLGRVVRL